MGKRGSREKLQRDPRETLGVMCTCLKTHPTHISSVCILLYGSYTSCISKKAMVFRVVMYGCESWTIKKAEHQRIDAFELWRSNQSILKEIGPEYSLEGLMLKLKLQYFDAKK